jgi:hypothetical protein
MDHSGKNEDFVGYKCIKIGFLDVMGSKRDATIS